MKNLFIIFAILFISSTQCFAFSIKVYDEYGNRVGTYKKEGNDYQFYDFNDNKVDKPESIIQDAPDQKTLTEYSRTFYDENMMPIGRWRSGFYGNDGRYYPRGVFCPYYTNHETPRMYIVRPRTHNRLQNSSYRNNINYIDTRYPRFHR